MKIIHLTIEDDLLIRASQLTGIVEQTALLKAALKALITLESHKKCSIKADDTEPDETFQAIMEISKRCAALPTQDYRSEDEILGYNDIGSFS